MCVTQATYITLHSCLHSVIALAAKLKQVR